MTKPNIPPNHVLQQATYTSEYLHQALDAGYAEAERAWLDLLQRHRHLYFDVTAPLTQYSDQDKRPRYYTVKQLQAAAATIEASTASVMRMQQQLLIDWHNGATCFQAIWRGYSARKHTKALLWARRIKKTERLFVIVQGIRRLARERRHRWVLKACRHIKALVVRAHACAGRIQRLIRLYLFKCHRWHAAIRLQRWYIHRIRFKTTTLALTRLHGFLKRQRRNALLEQYAQAALAARRREREQRQAIYISMKPDHVIVHRLVAARKEKLAESLLPWRQPVKRSSRSRSQAVLPLPLATNRMMSQAFSSKSLPHLAAKHN
ncbi:unnamed protein product [Aphanomyces euteiches]|uniref:Uncharacterized protein n=1 Tax=Aphanomyces euteiches TaxID=100861 RepID=A0A6G0XBF8_9STRA|nr:hypothetical protein Ae201684_006522 [Aphanomyces euteiches]KAH9091113.1 hypothetical protein Ae201684P_006513 [Aphanomyces euteiches]KAH9156171.1 hypothetical protein AeRB84_001891 [Aphanomyces euteiches]